MMKRYRYSGPVSGATLRTKTQDLHVRLSPGAEVELPDDHSYVRGLVARGHLVELAPEPKPSRKDQAATPKNEKEKS
jgi:hypothetical protein